MEVPRRGVELELQLPTIATAAATRKKSHSFDLHHSSRQRQILNLLSQARDRTASSGILVAEPQWELLGRQAGGAPGKPGGANEPLERTNISASALPRNSSSLVMALASGICLFVCLFLGLHPQHMEVPRLGVKWELQLSACTTATAMATATATQDLSRV